MTGVPASAQPPITPAPSPVALIVLDPQGVAADGELRQLRFQADDDGAAVRVDAGRRLEAVRAEARVSDRVKILGPRRDEAGYRPWSHDVPDRVGSGWPADVEFV